MEESKEIVAHSATYASQRLQSNFGSSTETRGPQHTARTPISSGGFQPASPLGNVSAATSTPLPHHSEVRSSIVSSGLTSSNLGRDSSSISLPRVERTHFRLDGKPNGSPYPPQVQGIFYFIFLPQRKLKDRWKIKFLFHYVRSTLEL